MVNWLNTDGQCVDNYVIAQEGLKKPGDRDYNGLVVRVAGVVFIPVPVVIWLFSSGLLELSALARRGA